MSDPDVGLIYRSELSAEYPAEKFPLWVQGMAWAFALHKHLESNAAVLRCRYCDHSIRFPTFPGDGERVNGLLWMMCHNYTHVAAGDVMPEDFARVIPGPDV
jgi:hypothetical protein